MRNQNPLEPMDNSEFIAQMAQFTALEQAQNTNKTVKLDSAYNLVDKIVKASYVDEATKETKEVVGLVSMVRVEGEKIYLKVDGREVLFDTVKEVTNAVGPYEQIETISQSFKVSSAFSLIGKDVKAKVPTDATGKNFIEVSAKVEGIRMSNGNIYAQIGEKEVLVDTIYQVN
jgi:flagellar basal-body rod modification protein FlgD